MKNNVTALLILMSFGDFETILSDTAVNYKNKSKNQYY